MSHVSSAECPHMPHNKIVEPQAAVCAECGVSSPTRVCLTCGHIGCCESSNGHARDHALSSGHAVIRELPLSDRSFTWCYSCNAYIRD